ADRNRSHWSTSKTPSYTKSVSWQHHRSLHLVTAPGFFMLSCVLENLPITYIIFALPLPIVLNKFILKPKRCPTFILNTTSSAGNNLIPVLGAYNR
ncbi:hypothetical protein, partial [Escherichia coli]|uniref:hypothetical protein n=2 Tax=Escherichia coli TaxID=562 RepID=UPI001BC89B37